MIGELGPDVRYVMPGEILGRFVIEKGKSPWGMIEALGTKVREVEPTSEIVFVKRVQHEKRADACQWRVIWRYKSEKKNVLFSSNAAENME